MILFAHAGHEHEVETTSSLSSYAPIIAAGIILVLFLVVITVYTLRKRRTGYKQQAHEDNTQKEN